VPGAEELHCKLLVDAAGVEQQQQVCRRTGEGGLVKGAGEGHVLPLAALQQRQSGLRQHAPRLHRQRCQTSHHQLHGARDLVEVVRLGWNRWILDAS